MNGDGELDGILDFLRAAERLKDTLRSGNTSQGRRESVAEHTWRLCLMALLLGDRFAGVDLARLLSICLVHDLGEALGGDVPATEQSPAGETGEDERARRERRDLIELAAPLPAGLRSRIVELWDDYDRAVSPEARIAKGLDKLETVLQHTQGDNPADFDYRFNLGYGRRFTDAEPTIAALRALVDAETERRAREG